MPPDADLIKVVFASGPDHLNRELIDRIASSEPVLPLYVVSEFAPERGLWIPYHVQRSFRENLASIAAALRGRRIERADLVLAPNVPLGKMRVIAALLAPGAVSRAGWTRYLLRRLRARASSPAIRRWLRRVAHPADAEIPLRARAAQVYGVAASRLRQLRREFPMKGHAPLRTGTSIVIPSRDGRALLEEMLPPLLSQLTAGEVIVSDNGSTDGTAGWLKHDYPAVRVIQTAAPLSFARAANAGVAAAQFNRILLLNNDMIVKPGFLRALDSAFERIPDLFCATAQIFFPAGVRREETGKAVWRQASPLDFPLRCDEPIPGEDFTWVLYGSGGCSLFDTAKLHSLGGVSEVFEPAYVEDLDLGYRAWKRGWPSVFCAEAEVEHRHRATTSRYYTPRELDAFVERNYLRFLIHSVGSRILFQRLWVQAVRRLQLSGNLDALRAVPHVGPRGGEATGHLTETEILALGGGDVAVFPGRNERGEIVVVATPYLPFPLSHGGAVRIFNLMKHVAESRGQVLVAFCDELAAPAPELLDICREVILVRRRGSHYKRATTRPDGVEEFDSEAYRACLKQTIQRWRPAVVQLEFTQMAQYADACRPARTILVEHDITFDLQRQFLATSTETGAARWELERQFEKWQAFETDAWRRVDCVVTMSGKDERAVSGAKRVACLPNGVDLDRFQPAGVEPEPRRLLFIGSFAHLPNLLALEFFLSDVWPLPGGDFTLHVIAGNRPEYFLDFHRSRVMVDLSQPGIELEGFVSDVRAAYRRAEIVLAPLTASAGTNIKVLEAMAMGRAIVSTPAGINGFDFANGRDLIVAESPQTMAEEILRLSADVAARKTIEAHAREAALQYDWKEIAQRQTRLYESLSPGQPSSVPAAVLPVRG